ncbi:hypothetical protein MSG28_009606 [Choristoneura fumiferana]|uniref:Uncharacterized protein n=1 Tax=Choristoneura fumiferana TaxID=7141 RepID=A0ACC0JC49_CHOFU|nr:hypothetical protein MSG28_009606 [Choristoneura fumiferana]
MSAWRPPHTSESSGPATKLHLLLAAHPLVSSYSLYSLLAHRRQWDKCLMYYLSQAPLFHADIGLLQPLPFSSIPRFSSKLFRQVILPSFVLPSSSSFKLGMVWIRRWQDARCIYGNTSHDGRIHSANRWLCCNARLRLCNTWSSCINITPPPPHCKNTHKSHKPNYVSPPPHNTDMFPTQPESIFRGKQSFTMLPDVKLISTATGRQRNRPKAATGALLVTAAPRTEAEIPKVPGVIGHIVPSGWYSQNEITVKTT